MLFVRKRDHIVAVVNYIDIPYGHLGDGSRRYKMELTAKLLSVVGKGDL